MNIQIGSKIKKFRLEKSMTQEQLAKKLGLSAQAISKWESNINMPDIQILPELAVLFGVSIDDLFTLTDESRMERIYNKLDNVRFFKSDEFNQDERFLKESLKNFKYEAKATLLLAELYNKRAEEYKELAKPLARRALLLNPTMKEAHDAIFDAEDGPTFDWDINNYEELISFYKDFIDTHPNKIRNYFKILDLLVHDHRLDEAEIYLERMKNIEYTYHYEMYKGLICKEAGNIDAAMDWFKKMTDHDPKNWVVWAEYGDIFAKLCKYDDAITYYKKAMSMRSRPRYIDCEDSVFHICMIQGDLKGALDMKKQSLQIVLEDWTTEGESVNKIKREISSLERQLK